MQVRERLNRTKKPWELDCGYLWVEDPVSGGKRRKRVQIYFRTKGEALAELDARKKRVKEHGRSALELSESERVRFLALRRRCEELGASMEEVVEFYARRHRGIAEKVTVGELVRRGLAAKEGRLREGSMVALRVSWGSFARGREEKPVEAVSGTEVMAWLQSGGWGMRTQRNYLADVRNLFGWARSPGVKLVDEDPTAGVKVEGRADEAEVTCMSPAQARRLLVRAREHYPRFLGYVALGLFAGLRTVELERLSFSDIDLRQGVVVVAPWQTRTRSRRAVHLSKNAVAWLRVWRKLCHEQEKVFPSAWEEPWIELRKGAGWALPWPKNVMRHTFASMFFAMHEDEARLKKELGHHASEDTLYRHYRAVKMLDGRIITRTVARGFWAVRP